MLEIAEGSFQVVLCNFYKTLIKETLRDAYCSETMYRVIQNWSNLLLPIRNLVQSSRKILIWLLNFNYDLKYFIRVGRGLKREVEGFIVITTYNSI